MLYKANVLLYDRQTESLWSQLAREAVTGPMTGTEVATVPSVLTTWKRWVRMHPDTLVLSKKTGYVRNYDDDPYENYHRSPLSFFGIKKKLPHLDEKELVLGVTVDGVRKVYPFRVLRKTDLPVEDTVGGTDVTVHFDTGSEEAYATGPGGERLPGFVSYWFVWYDFYPETMVYKPEDNDSRRSGTGDQDEEER